MSKINRFFISEFVTAQPLWDDSARSMHLRRGSPTIYEIASAAKLPRKGIPK